MMIAATWFAVAEFVRTRASVVRKPRSALPLSVRAFGVRRFIAALVRRATTFCLATNFGAANSFQTGRLVMRMSAHGATYLQQAAAHVCARLATVIPFPNQWRS